jgi:hypothetical protein
MSESNVQFASILAILALSVGSVCGIVGWVLPVGSEEGWNDINFEALSLGKGASAPEQVSILFSGNLQGLAFDGVNLAEQLYGGGEVLHGYKEGTAIYPHVHWMPTVNSSRGDITWFLEYSWANINSTYTAPVTLNVTQSVSSDAWYSMCADFPAIDGVGYEIGSHLIFRLYRDPTVETDTYEHDAVLLSVGVHYQVNSLGSAQLCSK